MLQKLVGSNSFLLLCAIALVIFFFVMKKKYNDLSKGNWPEAPPTKIAGIQKVDKEEYQRQVQANTQRELERMMQTPQYREWAQRNPGANHIQMR